MVQTLYKTIEVGNLAFSNTRPFVLLGGMNVLESEDLAMEVAEHFVEITRHLGIPYVFKASFDKANRSSVHSFRGPGLEKGLGAFGSVEGFADGRPRQCCRQGHDAARERFTEALTVNAESKAGAH